LSNVDKLFGKHQRRATSLKNVIGASAASAVLVPQWFQKSIRITA